MKKLKYYGILICFLIKTHVALASAPDQAYSVFADVLNESVVLSGSESTVNYASLKSNSNKLNDFVEQIAKVSAKEFEALSKPERLVFLINAYNALTIKLVVDNYPVNSIKDIGGIFSNPWKKDFFVLLGSKHSLDDIEHKMIRPIFNEPRIHFVLVCASKSCPRLSNKPYVAITLEAQMEEATNTFLGDNKKNTYSKSSNTFEVSKIFDWYGEDFVSKSEKVQLFLGRYMAPGQMVKNAKIKFLPYDWSLNDQAKAK